MIDLIEIRTRVIAKNARQIAVGTNGDDAVWLPLCEIDWEEIDAGGDEIIVTLPRDLAEERGLA